MRKNADTARDIIIEAIQNIPEHPTFLSHRSLDGAIITPRPFWPSTKITRPSNRF